MKRPLEYKVVITVPEGDDDYHIKITQRGDLIGEIDAPLVACMERIGAVIMADTEEAR
jgi:hypothetical protein